MLSINKICKTRIFFMHAKHILHFLFSVLHIVLINYFSKMWISFSLFNLPWPHIRQRLEITLDRIQCLKMQTWTKYVLTKKDLQKMMWAMLAESELSYYLPQPAQKYSVEPNILLSPILSCPIPKTPAAPKWLL